MRTCLELYRVRWIESIWNLGRIHSIIHSNLFHLPFALSSEYVWATLSKGCPDYIEAIQFKEENGSWEKKEEEIAPSSNSKQ